nr:YdaS family helix-turn-helix protein [Pseudoxanthomonas sp.]
MSAVKKLLDKAKDACEGQSYAALARRLDVTPQTVHQWKNGDVPMSAERIIEITKIARVNTDDWTLMVLTEQAKGAEKTVLEHALKRLGLTTAAVMLAMFATLPSIAHAATGAVHAAQTASPLLGEALTTMHYAK